MNFADLRVLARTGPVVLAPNRHLTAERLLASNTAADEVIPR